MVSNKDISRLLNRKTLKFSSWCRKWVDKDTKTGGKTTCRLSLFVRRRLVSSSTHNKDLSKLSSRNILKWKKDTEATWKGCQMKEELIEEKIRHFSIRFTFRYAEKHKQEVQAWETKYEILKKRYGQFRLFTVHSSRNLRTFSFFLSAWSFYEKKCTQDKLMFVIDSQPKQLLSHTINWIDENPERKMLNVRPEEGKLFIRTRWRFTKVFWQLKADEYFDKMIKSRRIMKIYRKRVHHRSFIEKKTKLPRDIR